MKRFQTPTSRNPVLVRRRAENRTYEVRKSLPGSTKTGRYIEIQRLKRLIYILSIPILSELISAGFSLWKTPDRKGMGKGAEWHNTQFCGLRSTRATRQGRWKPITKDRKNNSHRRNQEDHEEDPFRYPGWYFRKRLPSGYVPSRRTEIGRASCRERV